MIKPTNDLLWSQQENASSMFIGIITHVNPEKQTISGTIPGLSDKVFKDIPINHNVTGQGVGIRVTPTPGVTLALLIHDRGTPNEFYHLGYFIPDSSKLVSSKDSSKVGTAVLQRYVDVGEVHIISIARSEIFFSQDGSILLKESSGFYQRFSEYNQSCELCIPDLNTELYNVKFNVGRVKRVLKADAATNNHPSIIRDILNEDADNEQVTTHSEFTVDIGTILDPNTGAPTINAGTDGLPQAPTVGTLSLASKVFDQEGAPATLLTSLTNIVQFLLRMNSGIRIGINDLGDFYFVNEKSQGYLKFSPKYSIKDDKVVDETSLEYKTLNGVFKLDLDGAFTYTNVNKEDDKKNVSVTVTKDMILTVSITTGDDKFNTIILDDKGISVEDMNANKVTMKDNGVAFEDKNGNKITTDDSGMILEDKNGNKIEMGSSSVKINSNLEVLQ